MQITFTTSDYHGYNVSCFGKKNGSITANVTGGAPPYTYLWSNDQTTQTITSLGAGYYSVIVTDSDSVQVEAGINLDTPEPLKLGLESPQYNNKFNVSCFQCFNGSIITTVGGGVSPFSFQWKGETVTTQNRSNIGGGVYPLIVTDANSCSTWQTILLTEPERSDWTMGGNANTNSATNFIGTTDNNDLVFKTNGQERMRMLGNGNLKVYALADSGQGIISVDADGNLFRSNIHIGHLPAQGNTPEIFSYGKKAPDPGTLATYCSAPYLYTPITHQFEGMMESYNISNQNGLYNVLRFGSDSQHGIIDADGFIGYGQTAGQNSALLLNYYCGNNVVVGNGSNGKLGIGISPSYRLDVSGDAKISGNVGNGVAPSTGTTFRLKVCGSIGATEVVVDQNDFCDFVFEEDYKRMTFYEKENYLITNKHLPYISPGREIVKNGLPLKHTLTGLTQNVEEMSLDMIELYKAVQELKKENEELKSEI
ncbi:MAG: hypothetical protein NTV09_05955 [Bacteroidetes bacterium]|nr:hypothetical protein [Bacteroidota bacterium]